MTNVLLAIEGPLYGKVVEDFVVNHRWAPGTCFKLIHVVEPLEMLDEWPEIRFDLLELEQEKKVLAEMSSRIEKAVTDAHAWYEVRHGYPKEEIIAEATEWPANMIVMGSHGRHGLERILMGSVSMSTMVNAPCSVVIVRLPKSVEESSKKEFAVAKTKKSK